MKIKALFTRDDLAAVRRAAGDGPAYSRTLAEKLAWDTLAERLAAYCDEVERINESRVVNEC